MKNKLLEMLGIEKLVQSLQSMVENRVAMIKEEVEEKVIQSIAKAIPLLLFLFAICLFVVFGSIALAIYITQLTSSAIIGFSSISGFYLLLAIVLYLIKDNPSYKANFYDQVKKRKNK